MTLAEKASLTSGENFWNTKGIDHLGVPSIMMTDGPHGLRKQAGSSDHLGLNNSVPATCFPTAATLANSWSTALLYRIGEALGHEAAAEGVSVVLGPGLNIKRNPLGGRNFEYFSEDPLLSGELAAAFIQGIQSQGIGASVKHFAVNSQETHRMSIDEIVDQRALHELYLEGFRIAVQKGRPFTLMTAYNRVNGEYANENRELLVETLRDRWGFDGLVVTDWGGNNDRVLGIKAGNALEMPSTGGITDAEVVRAVREGELDESVLDHRVDELLTLIDRTAQARTAQARTAEPRSAESRDPGNTADLESNHRLAEQAALEGMVLLRNREQALPLRAGTRVAVIGDFADDLRIQGAGSSLVNATRKESPLDYLAATDLEIAGFARGYKRHGGASDRLRVEARLLASQADTVLMFAGLDESSEGECADRRHMKLPKNQLVLLHDLLKLGHRVVLVLVGGSPVELPFAGSVDAILAAYLPGQGGARAIADLLTGTANPSSRLAETWPIAYDDVPSPDFGLGEATQEHRESIFAGYRYYDRIGLPVQFCFGHGLSYTTFGYSDLVVDEGTASVTIRNTGQVAGAEVVQVYVRTPQGLGFIAPQTLQGFARVDLQPGESQTVHIPLGEHAFSVYDADGGGWRVLGGDYQIMVGASSRDIRLHADWHVDGNETLPGPDSSIVPTYFDGRVPSVSTGEFQNLLGRPVPSSLWDRSVPLTRADILAQCMGRGGAASALHAALVGAQRALIAAGRPIDANQVNFALDLPFRSLPRLTQGSFSEAALDRLLAVLNGDWTAAVRGIETGGHPDQSTEEGTAP